MKNLTYDQLIELAPKDRPFQIETESGFNGYNESIITWARINPSKEEELETWYGFNWLWKHTYKGTFTLIDPKYQKPEVLKVGQRVKIMESARECGDFRGWGDMVEDMIGKTFEIEDRDDGVSGVNYLINGLYTVPHYCVMPVEEEEEERTLEDILSELSDTDKEIIKSKLK
jgi:hypothetical protein